MPAILRNLRTDRISKPKDVAICRLHNRLLPALKLCPDLVEYLFLLGACIEDDEHHRRRAVLSYSQVCHDWRNAVLGIKSLWAQLTDFDDMSWSWNEEMLRRSHPLPIEVGSCTFPPREAKNVSSELDHLDRIRTYRLGFMGETWEVLNEKLQHPAEGLEYLSLAYVPFNSLQTQGQQYILPSNLFDNRAPQLKRLKLEGCIVDFHVLSLRSLTSLTVFDHNSNHKLTPTVFDWITLLSTMPFLTDLFIKGAMSPASSSSDPHVQFSPVSSYKIRMPHLSSLHLEASMNAVATFLDHTILPSVCYLSATCAGAQPGAEMDGVLKVFVGALDQRLQKRREMETHSLPFLIYAHGSTLSVHTDERALGHEKDRGNPSSSTNSFHFYLHFHAHLSGCWEPLLSPVLSSFSDPSLLNHHHPDGGLVSCITSLEILLPTSHPALPPFLRKATYLEALVNLPSTMTKNLLPELRFVPPHRSDSPTPIAIHPIPHPPPLSAPLPVPYSSEIPLPRLHTISFNDDKSAWGVPYGTLMSFLRWRTEDADAPVSRVIFRRCAVLEEKILELENLGVRVECDREGLRWQNL